tara:strand:- start:1163 stop:1468 length:306 start_codon:yes stop_codon:yes gene_type:complete
MIGAAQTLGALAIASRQRPGAMAADIDETIERPVAAAHDQHRHPSERAHNMIARRGHCGAGTQDLPALFEDRRLLDTEPVIAAIEVWRQGRGLGELMRLQT